MVGFKRFVNEHEYDHEERIVDDSRTEERRTFDQRDCAQAQVNIDGYATAYAAFATGDTTFANGYTDIPCPFLAMTGGLDLNSTPAISQNMAELVQNGCTFILQGYGYMTNLTTPDKVNAILLDWLNTG